jgi:hypothetical protein
MSFLKDLVQSDSTGAEMSDPARARSRDLHHRVRSIQEYREVDLHDGESGSQGISDPTGRLGLARASSRFLVVGETQADAEHRVPTY